MHKVTNRIETSLAAGKPFVQGNICVLEGTVIGSGKFGKVYLGHLVLEREKFVAVKVIKGRLNNENVLPNEVQILKRLAQSMHENIVTTYQVGATNKMNEFYIGMEYCAMGDLRSFVDSRTEGIYLGEVKTIMQDMATAITHIHNLGIVHRDIKLKNILVTERSERKGDMDKHQFKLGDFGLSCFLEKGQFASKICGTTKYMAPEMMNGLPYNHSVDLYSLGITLHALVFGDIDINEHYKNPPQTGVEEILFELVDRLIWHNPEERMTVEELCSHPLLLKKTMN